MIHGFPGLARSWRHQLPALASAGYHAVAVDSLGYGGSDRPDAAEHYRADNIQACLLGILDHFGVDQAIIVGQDFGAQYAWNLAARVPARVRGLVATIPYDYDMAGRALLGSKPQQTGGQSPEPVVASPNHRPSARFAAMAEYNFVHLHYFQTVGPADRELSENAREFLKRLYYALSAQGDLIAGMQQTPPKGSGYLDALPAAPPLPWSWMSEAEFEQIVAGFEHPEPMKRFIGGLNSYRTADANWEIGRPWANTNIDVPALLLYGNNDPAFSYFANWKTECGAACPGCVSSSASPVPGIYYNWNSRTRLTVR